MLSSSASTTPSRYDRVPFFAALLTALAVVCLTLAAWSHKSATYDEPSDLMAGWSYWVTGDFRLNPEHPPLTKLLAAASMALFSKAPTLPAEPWRYPDQFELGNTLLLQGGPELADQRLRAARLPMALLAGFGVFFVFALGRRLWGGWGGLVSATLFAANPTLLAHGCLVTNDVAVATFLLLSLWAFWDLLERPTPWKPLVVGLAMGLAMSAKYNGIFLLPAFALLVMINTVRPLTGEAPRLGKVWAAFTLLIIFLGAWTICTIFYLWPPKPLQYWRGVFRLLFVYDPGYLNYFWGHYSLAPFFWYQPGALLLKTPLAALIALGLSFAVLRRRHLGRVAFLLVPALCLLLPTMLWAKNIGVRYAIPVWAVLAVLAGVSAAKDAPWPTLRRWALVLLLSVCWFSTIRAYPNYLPYFNVLARGEAGGIRYLDDSNLDWGQEVPAALDYLKDYKGPTPRLLWRRCISPVDYGARAVLVRDRLFEYYFPQPTTYLVSAHLLARPLNPWRKWFKPQRSINGSVYVYRFRLSESEPSHFDTDSGINVINRRQHGRLVLAAIDESPYWGDGDLQEKEYLRQVARQQVGNGPGS